MKVTCDYCGTTYEDTLNKCPSCNAPNPTHKSDNNPTTIEELERWYLARHLPPPDKTRFYIGIDYRNPKAFGIYKDENGDFIVYKNKADGSRAIRYKGKDETYAVNEIFQKLKDEIVHQKNHSADTFKKNNKLFQPQKLIIILWFSIVIGTSVVNSIANAISNRHRGYYEYNGTTYYNYQNHWFEYEPEYLWDGITIDGEPIGGYGGGWTEISSDSSAVQDITSDYDYYYLSSSWDSSIEATNWNDSSYYDDYTTSNSDSSDYDWDSGSDWDSGGTDWDSDW